MKINPHSFRLFIFCIIIVAFFSCKKYEQKEINDNIAPPDHTISNVTYENYVNKVYISVLGRKPDSVEYEQGLAMVKKDYLSQKNRGDFLDTVFSNPEYYNREFKIALTEILEGADTADFTFWIYIINDQLSQPGLPQNIIDQFNYEKARLETFQQKLPQKLNAGLPIDIIEMHKLCVNNLIYDMINMGTLNFVVSVFHNFLSRNPSGYPVDSTLAGQDNELNNSSKIVDGQSSILFLKTGKSKDDFINIFFDSDDYYEGQVIYLFDRYLYRKPNTEEEYAQTTLYKSDKNFKSLQERILSMDEYVGIK